MGSFEERRRCDVLSQRMNCVFVSISVYKDGMCGRVAERDGNDREGIKELKYVDWRLVKMLV